MASLIGTATLRKLYITDCDVSRTAEKESFDPEMALNKTLQNGEREQISSNYSQRSPINIRDTARTVQPTGANPETKNDNFGSVIDLFALFETDSLSDERDNISLDTLDDFKEDEDQYLTSNKYKISEGIKSNCESMNSSFKTRRVKSATQSLISLDNLSIHQSPKIVKEPKNFFKNMTPRRGSLSMYSTEDKNFVSFDPSASLINFSKKMPLPPTTASGSRAIDDNFDITSLSNLQTTKILLTPVKSNASTIVRDEIKKEEIILNAKKLEPILKPYNVSCWKQEQGAIPKQRQINQLPVAHAINNAPIHSSLKGKSKAEGTSVHFKQPLSNSTFHVVPNSANIRELMQRRDKIWNDHMSRLSRQKQLISEEEFEEETLHDQSEHFITGGTSTGGIKLPMIIQKDYNIPLKYERPRTPIMTNSDHERRHLFANSKFKYISGIVKKSLSFMCQNDRNADKDIDHRSTKAYSIPQTSKTDYDPTSLQDIATDETLSFRVFPTIDVPLTQNVSTTELPVAENPETNDSSSTENIKQHEVSSSINDVSPELCSFLGNFRFDSDRKSLVNADLLKKLYPTSESSPELNELNPGMQRFCRRFSWSVQAAVYAELGKIYRKSIERALAHEDTIQVIYEHDVGYWATQISNKILKKVIKSRPRRAAINKTPKNLGVDTMYSGVKKSSYVKKPSKKLALTSVNLPETPKSYSSEIFSSTSAATQTSNISTPTKIHGKSLDLSEILQKLEQLNVKLESGKPVYKNLVETETKALTKISRFESWVNSTIGPVNKYA